MKKEKKEKARITEKTMYASLLAMVVSCLMLFESTYAWFTQTVSTPVSVIQTGNMNVSVVVANNDSFVAAIETDDNGEEENNLIFREYDIYSSEGTGNTVFQPGRTYCLPEIYIQNNGNIDLNYTITLAHAEPEIVDGVEKKVAEAVYANSSEAAYKVDEQGELVPISLYDVLEFSACVVTENVANAVSETADNAEQRTISAPIPLVVARDGVASVEAENENQISGTLKAGDRSEAIVIQVKMKEEADITYAGLELSGLQIIVNASQLIPESKSAEE